LDDLEEAAALVHAAFPGTPQYRWPLLAERLGTETWVKHENHTPTGAFKVRGGLVYLAGLAADGPAARGVVAATRGNHGQSIATAAARYGLRAVIVVPEGNSVEKNAAMRAQGAELVVHGHDFQASLEHAVELAAAEGLHLVPSFHPLLVRGVASYALELFRGAGALDVVYVPIGLGSGICGVLAARDALGLTTEVVGVVAEAAPCYLLSFAEGRPVSTDTADTFADGMACRVPDPTALDLIRRGVSRVVAVSEDQIAAAMLVYHTDTHNLAEGAGAAALAAALSERELLAGRRVGLVLTGGNVDLDVFAERVLR
jgi:threonine dehydratase